MLRSIFRNFAAGLLMGGADIIPGVSGGTMALIMGVYEALVAAVSQATSLGLALVRFDGAEVKTLAAELPWRLILPLGGGILLAAGVGARVIPPLMDAYPYQMNGLFLGLVAASLVIPAMRISTYRPIHAAFAIGCAALAYFLVGLPVFSSEAPGLLRVFGSAAVAICAMILPGISGAFLLKALGMYEPTLEALNGFLSLDMVHAAYVLTFCAGAAFGLGSFAKLLDWLLQNRHDMTMAALLGLITGALRALWPYLMPDKSLRLPEAGEPVFSVLAFGVLGLGAVLGLIWWSHREKEPVSEV